MTASSRLRARALQIVDERADLVRRLQEYERFKRAAEDMDTLPRLERDVWRWILGNVGTVLDLFFEFLRKTNALALAVEDAQRRDVRLTECITDAKGDPIPKYFQDVAAQGGNPVSLK